MAMRPTSSPKAATILASASARSRSERRWLPACWPITICVTAPRWVRGRHGRSPSPAPEAEEFVSDNHQRVEAAISAFAKGEIVVVMDDDDRENEGDLCVAASLCTPEKMAFIIRNTSGIVCAPLASDLARRLHLDPMVAEND